MNIVVYYIALTGYKLNEISMRKNHNALTSYKNRMIGLGFFNQC